MYIKNDAWSEDLKTHHSSQGSIDNIRLTKSQTTPLCKCSSFTLSVNEK